MPDRSTGVQQALVAYKHRYCGGRVHLENRGEGEWYLAAVCDRCGDTDGLDLEAVRVVEAVSPEPREPWTEDDLTSEEDAERSTHSRSKSEELKARAEALARERCPSVAPFSAGGPLRCELTAGHEGEHYNGGTASGYWSDREAEPREGEQETVPLIRRGRVTPELSLTDEEREDAAGPPPDPSVSSVLRLTASRLRDPEYHWYEHAAVTLERLAERLEKEG